MTETNYVEAIGRPHLDSFNYALKRGFQKMLFYMPPFVHTFEAPLDEFTIKMKVTEIEIEKPMTEDGKPVYPQQCRLTDVSYAGKLFIHVDWSINGVYQEKLRIYSGKIPIMVKSRHCHLYGLNGQELIEKGEHADEFGGYFIIRGIERLVRMLVVPKSNFPITVKRKKWNNNKKMTTEYGVYVRSVRSDYYTKTNVLHHSMSREMLLAASHTRKRFYFPALLILRALVPFTDKDIYYQLVGDEARDGEFERCVMSMLMESVHNKLSSYAKSRAELAKMAKDALSEQFESDDDAADFVLNNLILPHAVEHRTKFNFLKLMMKKLHKFQEEQCVVENSDTVDMQEVFVAGYLYVTLMRQCIEQFFESAKAHLFKHICGTAKRFKPPGVDLILESENGHWLTMADFEKLVEKASFIGSTFDSTLATGKVKSSYKIELPQYMGLTIPVDQINRLRVISQFRSIHRGKFFEDLPTVEVRRLTGEAWGFICPIETPDGAPCGLLNHLTKETFITNVVSKRKNGNVAMFLFEKGMVNPDDLCAFNLIPVLHNGIVIGYFDKTNKQMEKIVEELRKDKIEKVDFPKTLEITYIKPKKIRAQYFGLYLSSNPFRMMRPVINNKLDKVEFIGAFEQVYMGICLTKDDIEEGFTHREINDTFMFSHITALLPVPEHNPAPRNIYACQMAKQSMGIMCHNYGKRNGSRLYQLATPASPLFKTTHYDKLNMDDYPIGFNAYVVVVSYTGYDMEDAIVINKAAVQRGFGFGSIYKSQTIALQSGDYFMRDPDTTDYDDYLDEDGLPRPGERLQYDKPLYCYYSRCGGNYVCINYKLREESIIDNVRVFNNAYGDQKKDDMKACITYRIPRPVAIGDKFANRSGQKNICSLLYNQEDLPFSETGMVPDIIFNPHGFTSRMTVSMFIEAMAGKCASIQGRKFNADPFQFTEKEPAYEYFGEILEQCGYNCYGNETFYSGITGEPFEAQVFAGIIYYERLRHMVSDKWQVRSTGAVDIQTRQPVAGRKRDGAVRFGEMERDALISHGCTAILKDRMFHNSDKTKVYLCEKCASFITPLVIHDERSHCFNKKIDCLLCKQGDKIRVVEIPWSWYYFIMEMAIMNIHVHSKCNPKDFNVTTPELGYY